MNYLLLTERRDRRYNIGGGVVAAVSLKCAGQGVGLCTFLFQNRKHRKHRRDRKQYQHAKTAPKNLRGCGLGVVALGGAVNAGQ